MTNQTDPNQASPVGGAAAHCSTRRHAYYFCFLLFVLLLMVIAGGSVRLTGSGMSIPDWPIIHYGPNKTKGSILPPTSEAKWEVARQTYYDSWWSKYRPDEELTMARFKREFTFEYTHRAIGKTIGLLLIGGLIAVMTHAEARRRCGLFLVGSFAMFATVVVLGGVAVRLHTPTLAVAIHLSGAFLFIGTIMWTALRLMRPDEAHTPERAPWLMRFVWFTAAVALLQIFFGGLVAKSGAGRHFNTWPTMAGQWIPNGDSLWQDGFRNPMMNLVENIVLMQFIHRWLAFAAAALLIATALRVLARPITRRGRLLARVLVFLTVSQILLGILTLLEAVPYLLGIAHLVTGLMLFQTLIALAYEVRNCPELLAHEDATIFHRTPELEAKPA